MVDDGCFEDLSRGLHSNPKALVVGPMTDTHGLGLSSTYFNTTAQNVERRFQPSAALIKGLPNTLPALNRLVQGQLGDIPAPVVSRPWVHGFFLAFKKDRRIEPASYPGHVVDPRLVNLHQEAELYSRVEPMVVQSVVVYHHGSGTMNLDKVSLGVDYDPSAKQLQVSRWLVCCSGQRRFPVMRPKVR